MPKLSVRLRAVAAGGAAMAALATVVLVPVLTQAPAARAEVAPGATIRASVVDGTNAEAELGAYQQELAAGGNAVVFTSDSQLDDLATSPDGEQYANENVYVRDLSAGRTVMISRGQFSWPESAGSAHEPRHDGGSPAPEPVLGEVPPNQDSYQPTISADGRFVAFVTTATNIVRADDDHDQDIIVCDRDPDGDGTFDEDRDDGDRDYRYFRVTTPIYDHGREYRTDDPRRPRLSDDASRIVWQDQRDVEDNRYARVRTATLRLTPAHDPGPPTSAGWVPTPLGDELLEDQAYPDVSGDGRFVVLSARFLKPRQDHHRNDLRHDAILRVDTVTSAITRVDLDRAGDPIGTEEAIFLSSPVISRDGTVIAFEAEWYDYDPCDGTCWDRGGLPDVHAVGVGLDGRVTESAIVSRDNAGDQVNGVAPGLSGDGRFVSFVTDNRDAHDGVDDVDGHSCLFRQDDGGTETPKAAEPPVADARTDRTSCQVVVRDLVVDRERLAADAPRLPGALASPGTEDRCADPMPADGTCGGNADTTPFGTERSPTLAADGHRIAYESAATDLVPDVPDNNDAQDVFVRTFRPELRADPGLLDFGEVLVDTPVTATVRLDHVGIGPLVVAELAIEGAGFTVADQTCVLEGAVVQQAGGCLVEIEFRPPAENDFAGVLRLVLTDDREFTVDLVGVGVLELEEPGQPGQPGSAAFAAAPDPVSFGSRLIRSTGPAGTVTVTNTGGGTLTVSGVTVEPPAASAHYTVTANTCAGAPLAPGASCAVTVSLVPAAGGDLSAVLSFEDDAAGAPHLVGLTGSAPTPEIELSPAVTQPGRVVTVIGTGFTPNQLVVATAPLAVQTNPVTVAADGTFRSALLILPKSTAGNRVVVAKVTVFPEVNAEQPLLVVTPTVGPAEFVVRG
ncbi:choice-of-anchor D domain-containing protein [Actinophytocola sediminis]